MSMEFETQRELLEYLWKNVNDRSLVQRLIAQWRVVREWGKYILLSKEGLIEEVNRLREENYKLREELFKKDGVWENEASGNDGGNDGDLEFQIKENEKLEKQILVYQNAIKESYYYVNSIGKVKIARPDYKEKIKLRLDVSGEYDQ